MRVSKRLDERKEFLAIKVAQILAAAPVFMQCTALLAFKEEKKDLQNRNNKSLNC